MLNASNPLGGFDDLEKQMKIFGNYWIAISRLLDGSDGKADLVLYKYNGVQLFSRFSLPFFLKLQATENWTLSAMQQRLERCFENMDSEQAVVGHPDWWRPGGGSSYLNSAAMPKYVMEMTRALNKTSNVDGIEV